MRKNSQKQPKGKKIHWNKSLEKDLPGKHQPKGSCINSDTVKI